jgi:succinyl-CoA synthetase beta subunit
VKIQEYQAASLLKDYGIETVPGELADCADQAAGIAQRLGGKVVVKAQVLVGGRGKAGGVRLAHSPEEAKKIAGEILGMEIKSIPVKKVWIARAVEILQEYYLGVTIDRTRKKTVLIASAAGGVEIEELAVKDPGKIQKLHIDPLKGIEEPKLRDMVLKVFGEGALSEKACEILRKMYRLFMEKDCSLVEINPCARTAPGKLVAADSKIIFDDNALFKHPDIVQLESPEEHSPDEIAAREAGLSFVSMEGNIGCIVNGAGLAMATMDVIKLFGGDPANFLDVGGSSNPKKVLCALRIILSNPKVRAILINIFGGITRCDDIANGILMAKKELNINVPLVIRLVGTNEKEGKEILTRAGFIVAEDMTEAVRKVVGTV